MEKFRVRSEEWYREMLRTARMFATNELVLDCQPLESDRDCLNRCKAEFLAAIDGALMHELPVEPTYSPSSALPTVTRLEQCGKHMGRPMTLLLLGSFHAVPAPSICPNCEDEKRAK